MTRIQRKHTILREYKENGMTNDTLDIIIALAAEIIDRAAELQQDIIGEDDTDGNT